MEKIALEISTPGEAAEIMAAAGLCDKDHQFTPESLANIGQAFKLTTAGGSGVFVAELRGNHLWIHGAATVQSHGMTAAGLAVIEALAKECGAQYIAFETKRAGLVRRAKKHGYTTNAVIMKKKVGQ